MTKQKVEVSPEFLQKVVGFAEATNAMMKSAEDRRSTIREAAQNAVDVLEKAGKLEEGHDKEKLIQGFVSKPEMALKLAASLVKEGEGDYSEKKKDEGGEKKKDEGGDKPFPGAAEPFNGNGKKDEGEKQEKEDEEGAIGAAAESENSTKRAAETQAAPANITSRKESDEVWDKGFGFGS